MEIMTFDGLTEDGIADMVDDTLRAMGSEWEVGYWVIPTGLFTADLQLIKTTGDYRPSEIVTVELQSAGIAILSSWVAEVPC